MPVGVAKGWFLQNVVEGLRLWTHRPPLVNQKAAPAAASKTNTWALLASSCKVELLPQVCLECLDCVCVRVRACVSVCVCCTNNKESHLAAAI